MIRTAVRIALAGALVAMLALAGCATTPTFPVDVVEPVAGRHTARDAHRIDREPGNRILALDPERVSASDVADVLSKVPAPRIMLIHGGVYPVYLAMESFGEFLVGMGYPEAKIRDPGSGVWSYSPYAYTPKLAGILAWAYEQDAMRPMLIGHSQGGLYVVKVLKELAGVYRDSLPVWDPVTDAALPRDAIVDPYTGRIRPAIGVTVSYASAIGAGGWSLILPNQWDDFRTLRVIPDTVDEFTGFSIEDDPFALSFPVNPLEVPYTASGTAKVRNVALPPAVSHVLAPVSREFVEDAKVRQWIEDYVPGRAPGADDPPAVANGDALWAADVWHSVKRHWVLEAQRMVKAQRGLPAGG